MTVRLTPRKKLFVDAAAEMFGNGSTITKDNARIAAEKAGGGCPSTGSGAPPLWIYRASTSTSAGTTR